jgi:hypothetical protein
MSGSFEGFLTRRPPQLVEGTPGAVPRSSPQPGEAWTDELQRTHPPFVAPAFSPGSDALTAPDSAEDPLEREADRVGDEVMASASDSAHAIPRPSASTPGPRNSSGFALGAEMRGFFEPRLAHNLADVRIHADADADTSARALRARAYTVGKDIVFARGHYAPGTRRGRALLAHELAHVVQQSLGLGRGIQRAPDDPSDAGALPDAAPVLDPDVNEAAARARNPDLAQIDRGTRTPKENEAAVQAVVMEAFGSEDDLNKEFEKLSPAVIVEVDKYAAADLAARTANRTQFLVRMRLYFDSWALMLDHFRNFVAVKRPPNVDVVLHKDAAARLQRALDVLHSKGHSFPQIGVGFGLRGFHRGEFQTPGFMIHALGFAIDVAAAENPKIGFMKPDAGPERHDPFQIASSIDPTNAHMDMGASNPAIIEAMGKRTATDNTLAAADDTDAVAKEYFQHFEQQFDQMQQGSLGFLGTISKDHRDKLLKLRQDYFDVLTALAAERKKGPKGSAAIISDLEAQRLKLLTAIPALVTEWVSAIDVAIAKTFKMHPGMDKLRVPSDIAGELKTAAANLSQARKDESLALAAKDRAIVERDAASAARRQAEAWEHHAPAGAEFKKALAAAATARQKLTEKVDAVIDALDKEIGARGALSSATQARDKLSAELKVSDDPKLLGAWSWIASLRGLRHALVNPDLGTPAGIKAFERLMIGDLQHKAPVDNPPLLRLLEAGFFNPKGAFDLAFFEEMAHSGFWPGATWAFGGADPMHFELLEGRNRIRSPGKFPPK